MNSMNNRQNNRRRGRNNNQRQQGGQGGRGGDSGNRIDSRARGNAAQLLEKYKNMARDAQMSGDRVMTEYYLQFADHYFRVLADVRARQEEQRARYEDRDDDRAFGGDRDERQDGDDGDEDMLGGGDEPRARSDDRDEPRRDGRRPREMRDGPREGRPRRDDRSRRNADPADDGEGGNRAEAATMDDAGGEGAAIDVAVLPPAIGVQSDALMSIDEPAARPRRRTRKAAEAPAEG